MIMLQEETSFQNFLAFKQFCQTNSKYLLLLRTLEMDVMDTCSEGDGVRDLGEEDVLSSPPPGTVTPPGPATPILPLGTPMMVDQPQSPLSPVTMLGHTQLDLSVLDTSNIQKREPSQK